MDNNPGGYFPLSHPSYTIYVNDTFHSGSKVILRNPYEEDMWYQPYMGSSYIVWCRWDIFDADMKIVSTIQHKPSFNEKVQKYIDGAHQLLWGFNDTYEYEIPSTFLHEKGKWKAASYFLMNDGMIIGEQRYLEFEVEGNFFYDFVGNLFFSVSPLDLCVCLIFIIFVIYLFPSALARDRRPFFESLQAFLKKQKVISKKTKISRRHQSIAIILIFLLFVLLVAQLVIF